MELTLLNLITRFLFGAAYTAGGVAVIFSTVWFIARLSGITFLPTKGVETTTGVINTEPGGYPWARLFRKRRKPEAETPIQ